MKFLRSRRGLAALAALILILFLFRPGVYRLRNRIGWSIGSAIGRRVSIDNVRVHILPRPGFDLEGLTIFDAPRFSSEPMVRAPEVSAAIRFRSLLRGRLEIATLSATEPSINLVRNDQGEWNLASLLERSQQVSTAPTESQPSFSRPSFPYLEATHARINFKVGQEKKSFALSDADVTLWQESENAWGARLSAQPTRTDLNLTDMGVVRVNATWHRAPNRADTPVQIAMEWRNGQLGQITRFFSGRDRGWRGSLTVQTSLSGNLNALQIESQMHIDDFRRYDIMSSGVPLSTLCSGRYNVFEHSIGDLACESAVGTGSVRFAGRAGFSNSQAGYDLTLALDKVPLTSAIQLLRQAKKGLPEDLEAAGRIDGMFHASGPRFDQLQLTGKGSVSGVGLSVNGGKEQITAAEIPLALSADERKTTSGSRSRKVPTADPPTAQVNIGPFAISSSSGAPLTAGGWVTPSGYRFFLRGKTEIRNVYRVAHTAGIQAFKPAASGFTTLDLAIAGSWAGFASPVVSGTAQLQDFRTGMRGLNPPIEIGTALIKLDPDQVSLQHIGARIGETRWKGSVTAPRNCQAENCIFRFDLTADQLTSGGIAEWITPKPARRPWYAILGSQDSSGKSPLLAIRATGTLHIGRIRMKNVEADQILAKAELDRGKITVTDIHGRLLQGSYQGRGVIDLSLQPPHYQWSGTLQNVSLAAVSTAMHDGWATGIGDARFEMTSSGSSASDLMSHLDGEVKFEVHNGTLVHLEISDAPRPFPVHLFAGRIQLKNGIWHLRAGKMESHDGIYQISGTASGIAGLNLTLVRGDDQSWNVTGSLVKPHVVPAARTQAKAGNKATGNR